MEAEFLVIVPLVAILSGLFASNAIYALLKLSHHSAEAKKFARVLSPYLFLFRLGGREAPHRSDKREA